MTRLTLRAFGPAQSAPNRTQALSAAFEAMAGLLITHSALWGLGRLFGLADLGLLAHPLLMPPLGALAVLIYTVPSSPLAQPWSVVVGTRWPQPSR